MLLMLRGFLVAGMPTERRLPAARKPHTLLVITTSINVMLRIHAGGWMLNIILARYSFRNDTAAISGGVLLYCFDRSNSASIALRSMAILQHRMSGNECKRKLTFFAALSVRNSPPPPAGGWVGGGGGWKGLCSGCRFVSWSVARRRPLGG